MKQTQYARILEHLRRAGSKGATVRDLLAFTNYPSARLREIEDGDYLYDFGERRYWGMIARKFRRVNGRQLRVYVLRRI